MRRNGGRDMRSAAGSFGTRLALRRRQAMSGTMLLSL
jgi:hypothetical protein